MEFPAARRPLHANRTPHWANAEQSFVAIWKQMSSDQQGKFIEVLVAYVRSPMFDQRSAP